MRACSQLVCRGMLGGDGEFSAALEKDYEEVGIEIAEVAEEDEGDGDEWH